MKSLEGLTDREKLAALKDIIGSNDREINILAEANQRLWVARKALWKKIIEEEGLLAGKWKYVTISGDRLRLSAPLELHDNLKKVAAMCGWWDHDSLDFEYPNQVRVDDGDYSLIIKLETLSAFAERFGIVVDSEPISDAIEDLDNQSRELRKTLSLLLRLR